MNLTRVLNVALPEMPARQALENPPRVPPGVVFKEHIEDGAPVVLAVAPNKSSIFRFPPQSWKLIQLFNGQRSYQEIAEEYSNQQGAEFSVEDVREFAGSVESLGFWYKTPQETNIQLMRMKADERRKILNSKKNRFGDLSEITFPAFDPDRFVTWTYRYTSWVYTWWFTLLTLVVFAITIGISVSHWAEIGRDTAEFFNFADKSWGDVAVFYFLALFVLGFHELAHGHAAKHYGARVPAMGFLLIYLTPAFYTDTTEGYVRATKYERIVICMAGVWSELMICAVATPIWWATPPNTAVHEIAYTLMLMTGIAAVLLNWNPLMKLDGYQMLIEIVEVPNLKEDSTAYVAAWVKKHIWRLPVDVPYVPKSRRLGFAVYALLSGVYSYTVLYVLARFTGDVFRHFNAEWSFIPELAVAGLIFRSRIRKLVEFMKFFYLDKKDRIRELFTPKVSLAAGVAALLLLFLPIWNESVVGRFVLEPVRQAMVRTEVPGTVAEVFVREGMTVDSGAPLVKLRNLPLQSKVEESRAAFLTASTQANSASLHHANLGRALQERESKEKQRTEWERQGADLEVTSPLSGVVLTPRIAERVGDFLPEGSQIVELADLSSMRGRVYLSEYDLSKVHVGLPAKVVVDGLLRKWSSQVDVIAPISTESDPRLIQNSQYSGLNPPRFYVADLMLTNVDSLLKPGMVGTARIYVAKRSIAGLGWDAVADFFGRKVW
jgi:putative peptide zinc metalloprotease protein